MFLFDGEACRTARPLSKLVVPGDNLKLCAELSLAQVDVSGTLDQTRVRTISVVQWLLHSYRMGTSLKTAAFFQIIDVQGQCNDVGMRCSLGLHAHPNGLKSLTGGLM